MQKIELLTDLGKLSSLSLHNQVLIFIYLKKLAKKKHSNVNTSNFFLSLKVDIGQPVVQYFAWTCSALSILHFSNFKALAHEQDIVSLQELRIGVLPYTFTNV